jgi:hypothetical protein
MIMCMLRLQGDCHRCLFSEIVCKIEQLKLHKLPPSRTLHPTCGPCVDSCPAKETLPKRTLDPQYPNHYPSDSNTVPGEHLDRSLHGNISCCCIFQCNTWPLKWPSVQFPQFTSLSAQVWLFLSLFF